MKIEQLTNFKKKVEAFRKILAFQIDSVDKFLKDIDNLQSMNETRCPRCYSRDVRMMKNNRLFCRGCGFESPDEHTINQSATCIHCGRTEEEHKEFRPKKMTQPKPKRNE